MADWEKFVVARYYHLLLFHIVYRKVVLGAINAGYNGKRLEEKVQSVLVKGYKKGDKPEGTMKHM